MPAGLRWSLDWDCSVKSSCCGVNTLSTSSIPAYMKLSCLATWYSIIHAAFKSKKFKYFRCHRFAADRAHWWDWHLANSDVYPNAMTPVAIWWYIEVAQVWWSHVYCSSSSSSTRKSIKIDDAIYFANTDAFTVMIFSVWEWFNGTLPTNIFSRLLVNEGMWHESSREHLQEWEVDAIMGTCTQQLNIYNIHHTIFNLDH